MKLDVLSNNLANMNTVGFKEDDALFRAYLPGPPDFTTTTPDGALISGKNEDMALYYPGNYHVAFEGTRSDFSSGPLKHTGNALDLALGGEGFFCIKTPTGVGYTRKGDFSLNSQGALVTQQGLPVLGDAGEIIIDGTDVFVDKDGNISVDENLAGKLKIVDFSRPYSLKKVGDTMFIQENKGVAEKPAKEAMVSQGTLEFSNVDSLKIMTEMITVLRGYESYQKIMQIVDNISLKTINEVGSVG
jgi:flagellar basal-body rod protein FlgG